MGAVEREVYVTFQELQGLLTDFSLRVLRKLREWPHLVPRRKVRAVLSDHIDIMLRSNRMFFGFSGLPISRHFVHEDNWLRRELRQRILLNLQHRLRLRKHARLKPTDRHRLRRRSSQLVILSRSPGIHHRGWKQSWYVSSLPKSPPY